MEVTQQRDRRTGSQPAEAPHGDLTAAMQRVSLAEGSGEGSVDPPVAPGMFDGTTAGPNGFLF